MRKTAKRFAAILLSLIMILRASEGILAYAAQDPTEGIALSVPESLQDGENYFFIREDHFSISEKSPEKLYIPLQRTGDLEEAADLTLKVIDMSARYGVNYTAELVGGGADPEAVLDGLNVRDLFEHPDEQEELPEPTEDELGELLTESGGATFLDNNGEAVGTLNAIPVDENGDPVPGEAQQEAEALADEGTSEEEEAATAPLDLRQARNDFTGTVSDRQELEGGDAFFNGGEQADADRRELSEDDLVEDSYPGREFAVHFAPGQAARFLAISPRYSEAAEGDCSIMLMLKGLPENASAPEEWNLRSVTITDEDEPQPVIVSMAETEIRAQDGIAAVTVTRSGQLNNLVGVMISSQDGSAKAGDDYSGISAKLYFSMGMTQRTVEIPVGHGAQEEDFSLMLSPIPGGTDVTLEQAAAHVTIPAVEADAQLMADWDQYGEAWNLKDRKGNISAQASFDGDTAVKMKTEDDKLQTQYIQLHTDYDYAWDGIHVEYDVFTWYSKVKFEVDWYDYSKASNGWTNLYSKDWGDCSGQGGQSADVYFNARKAPYSLSIDDWCYEVHNAFRDSYTEMNINGVYPIKRNFTVKLVNDKPLSFEGMTADQILKEYQPVVMNSSGDTTVTYKTLDNFSVSRDGPREWARLAGLEAVKSNGSTLRLGTIDGKSGTVAVQLDADTINKLANGGYITWQQSGKSFSGSLTVRPVFEYVNDITVKVRETPYGTLKYNGKTLSAGTHTFHYGDKLTFTPNVDAAWAANGIRATGMGYESRKSSAAGPLSGKSDCEYYTGSNGGSVEFTLTEDYYEFWQVFSDVDNMVQVRVPAGDVQYFDTVKGLFAGLTPTTTGDGYQLYKVKSSVLTGDFIDLLALPKSDNWVPVWTLPNNTNTYSGAGFCFFAGVQASDNLVTLKMDRNAGNHAWYSLSGTVYSSTLNLETGHEAGDMLPVEGAVLISSASGAQSGQDGSFTMQPMYLLGGSMVRYTVSYNGGTAIKEVKLAGTGAPTETATAVDSLGATKQVRAIPVRLGNVKLESWNQTGAHFAKVVVKLSGYNPNMITAMEMNGKELTVTVQADPGQKYVYDGREYDEHITDVTLYFQSQITGEIHGIYSTNLREGESTPGLKWDAATNTATLNIKKFQPDAPEKYTWGDVLMAVLTTDKKTPGNAAGGMSYQPVSTGYAVVTDQDYQPETFDYDLDIASMMENATLAADEGDGGNTRYSFGKFPWLGSITSVIRTFSFFSGSGYDNTAQMILADLEVMGGGLQSDGSLMEDEDGTAQLMAGVIPRRWALSAAVVFKETPYGGVRTMIAVAGSVGNTKYSKTANPYRSTGELIDHLMYSGGGEGQLIVNGHRNSPQSRTNYVKSEFGGGYLYFTVYVGVYIDWGYIEVAKTDGSGDTEISHEAVFLGAGGFVGGKLTAGYTQCVFIPLPAYFNLEAGIDVTLFMGKNADPNKTLQSFYETTDHKGQDFKFELEVMGDVSIKASIGVGFYKLLGARATGGLGLQAGYSLRMDKWFPGLEGCNTVSFSTDAMFSGTVDVVVTSIDLYSASWPLPLGYGWLQYFQQMRRANALIHFINEGINDKDGSEEARAKCRTMADELGRYVDAYQGTGDELRKRVNEVQEYAYEHGVINWAENNRVDMLRQGGIIGNIMDTAMLTADEGETSTLFHTRDHVATDWVADESGQLMAAFGPVSSKKIMANAVSQPASQIMALGSNRFLVVFLDDDARRERQQASVLKWTVYDATADTWTDPKVVQNDGTADGRANLTDAGNKVVLSWASVDPAKLTALKQTVTAELKAKNGTQPSAAQIQAALEADPARVMALMEIYSAEFSKSAENFGAIEQLTDDSYYDDSPQAVYDDETGDYIVLYYKTAQDTEQYTTAEDRLLDLVGPNPDPDKTYSVLCYMLHNNQTSAKDTKGQTHTAGWARTYLFANETGQTLEDQAAFLQEWGGQRFLASALRSENGGQTDAPIADLTVCSGYNGLAAYAFTVDQDYDLDTTEDKELYVQFYRFADHKTYVPIKVAGEAVKESVTAAVRDADNRTLTPPSVTSAPTAVDVGQPKLIRNGGSTWLFWREDNDGLRYTNISEMLNAKVETGKGNNDWVYALQSNGSFATDPATNKPWTPNVRKVDFGSVLTDEDLDLTDYQVISDKDDNLYVVWTDLSTYDDANNTLEETVTSPVQAIYATAMIQESDRLGGAEGAPDADMAAWSKPYRLTRDNTSNDGVTVALDDDGGLILVHNQYTLELADTQEELAYMLDNHLAGIYTDEETGEQFFQGYPYYPSDVSLMVTRCEAVGSVEATQFFFSDDTPVAGDTVTVTAAVENVGLTTAEGLQVDFYEYKNGKQGRKLYSVSSEDRLPVNVARKTTFQWKVPADGPDGYSIQAVASEQKKNGSFYTPTETFSEVFAATAEYEVTMDSCVQNGDAFDVVYTVTNTGNLPAPKGTRATLNLAALHGDLQEQYGINTDLLAQEDLSGLAPGATKTVERSVQLPVSVFKLCGYDAVMALVLDPEGELMEQTDQEFIAMNAPMNLRLNECKPVLLKAGEKTQVPLTYDSTVFVDSQSEQNGSVIYSVEDPSIATVDENGNVTALQDGTTKLIATLLPSGRRVSVAIYVGEGTYAACDRKEDCPLLAFRDLDQSKWYHDGVHWALNTGVMAGYGKGKFGPNDITTRAQIVQMLWNMEGKPAVEDAITFKDVPAKSWYTEAVRWAAAEKIVAGYSAEQFGPNDPLTREQLATILYRYALYKGLDAGAYDDLSPFTDAGKAGRWARKPLGWAVGAGIIAGMGNGILSPKGSATRAQAAAMLLRFQELVA